MTLDLVIRGGSVCDGTGKHRFSADVGVSAGKIVEVGRIDARGNREIDADGLVVTPGFVDIHTHYDGQATWDPVLSPSSVNGVTSLAMGNCGVGFAPAGLDQRDWLISVLEGVEDIPGTALIEGLEWDWESFPEYLDALARRQFTVDLGAHIPHSALRAYVMGERGALPTEHPTDDELSRMAKLTFEALEAGALGFSTSRTYAHQTKKGEHLGTWTASKRELTGLMDAMRRAGSGVIQLITDANGSTDDDFVRSELDVIRAMLETSGRPLSFTCTQTNRDAPDRYRQLLAFADELARGGFDIKAQVAQRPMGAILGLSVTLNPFVTTPAYMALAALPLAERVAKLGTPEVKSEILAQFARQDLKAFDYAVAHDLGLMFRMSDPVDYEPSPENSILAEARRVGRDPHDYVYDVLLEEGGTRLIYYAAVNYMRGNLSDVHEMITAPHTLFGLSDGGAHCGIVSDASFPTTTLALWSRGNKTGQAVPLETLVQGYTSRNARHIGWHDRGIIAPGYLADLNVIDMNALSLAPPVIVNDLPAGGARLMQPGRGYRWTVKTGVVTFQDGHDTGERPGRLVRGQRSPIA